MPKHSNTYKAINRAVGKALHHYSMIADGDRIAVGLSGGKDSLTLLEVLSERKARVPVDYVLIALYIDPGFEQSFSTRLHNYCREKGYTVRIDYSDHGIAGHSPDNLENPCFLCSRLRRKRLFELADELDCNKLALGHTKDDIIETLFLNMCYAGEISTMVPLQTFFGGEMTVIRPLAFADENDIGRFAADRYFDRLFGVQPNRCAR